MVIGFFLIVFGILILLYPQILVAMIAGCLIMAGALLMATAWRFRRLKRQAGSRWMNWVIRY